MKVPSRGMEEILVSCDVERILRKELFDAEGLDIHIVDEGLKKLEVLLNLFPAVLEDAERRQATDPRVNTWLRQLEDVVYDAEDVLDGLAYEILRQKVEIRQTVEIRNQLLRKIRNFFSLTNTVAFRLNVGLRIRGIIEQLVKIYNLQPPPSMFIERRVESLSRWGDRRIGETVDRLISKIIIKREDEFSKVIDLLISGTSTDQQQALIVVPILGIAGLGKTTLARMVYKEVRERQVFDETMWIGVSENFNVGRILREMLEHFDGVTIQHDDLPAVHEKVKKKLENRSFLLILDDVWEKGPGEWDRLKEQLLSIRGENGKIAAVVTTRSWRIASMIESSPECTLKLRDLSDDECWSIIKQVVRESTGVQMIPSKLALIGVEIAKKCLGVPLLSRVLGWTMSDNLEEGKWLSIQNSWIGSILTKYDEALCSLKSSYDRLSSGSLKRCFAYCSIFPRGFNIEKEKLVQLWMAEGLLIKPRNGSREDQCQDHFGELVANSLFQNIQRDGCGNITGCTMHALMRELALLVCGYETYSSDPLEMLYLRGHRRHLNLISSKKFHVEFLFRLIVRDIDPYPWQLKYVQTLNADGVDIEELPASVIGKLKLLRYLDVSRTKITALPESITALYHLQTLRFSECNYLEKLPKNMKNLVRLRHLYFTGNHHMPAGVGGLTSLVALPFFIVGRDRGHKIEELGTLNELRGELRIRNLELVRSREEAHSANLLKKEKISKLRLEWSSVRIESGNDEDVLEGLQPHSNTRILEIVNYAGEKFPSWVSKSDLVVLKLENRGNLQQLPILGQLFHLHVLEITGMVGVISIGSEFYASYTICLPALKRFSLKGMESLEEWKGPAEAGDTAMVFPCLEELHIEECHQLKSIPSMSQISSKLVRLKISKCHALIRLSGTLEHCCTALEELYIASCPKLIGSDHTNGPRSDFRKLQVVRVYGCPKLTCLPIPWRILSCKEFHLERCWELISVDDVFSSSALLQSLIVKGYNKLTSVPAGLCRMTSLVELEITWCRSLISFPEDCFRCLTRLRQLRMGPFSNELEAFPGMTSIQHLSGCLKELRIFGWGKLKCLPDQLQHLTALSSLRLNDFNALEALPEWLGYLSSLQSLTIGNCWNLKQLPALATMVELYDLEKLHIKNCPLLKRNCSKDGGPEWHKISRIIEVKIDEKTIPEKGEFSRSQ